MPLLKSPLQAQVVQYCVASGQAFAAGDVLLILEAMKMEHELRASEGGRAIELLFRPGETVRANEALLNWEPLTQVSYGPVSVSPQNAAHAGDQSGVSAGANSAPRADLAALQDRLSLTQDAARPDAVARRHVKGQLTAREIVALLCDLAGHPERFSEYGALAVATQARRRSTEDLMANTPADGMVTGIGLSLIHI